MKLRTVRKLSNVLLGVILCLLALYWLSEEFAFVLAAFALMIVAVMLNLIFDRCPYCGHHLGRLDYKASFCPYCGNELFKE